MSKRIITLARRYHQRCEAFDRKICTGKVINGQIMPATKAQHKRIKYNTKFELEWTIALASFEGIDEDTIVKAIRTYVC